MVDTIASYLRCSTYLGCCVKQIHLYCNTEMAPLTANDVVLVPWCHSESIQRTAGRQSGSERLPLKGECSIEYSLPRRIEWNDGDVKMILPRELPIHLA